MVVAVVVERMAAADAKLIIVQVEEEGKYFYLFAEYGSLDTYAVDADIVVLFAPILKLEKAGKGGNGLIVEHHEVFATDGGST